jgi:hypothetical protein
MDHGAKYDPISVEDKIDRGGDINLICPHGRASRNTAGMVVSGYLVEVQKADMESLRSKYPEAFKRPMDPAYGPDYNSWVVGG